MEGEHPIRAPMFGGKGLYLVSFDTLSQMARLPVCLQFSEFWFLVWDAVIENYIPKLWWKPRAGKMVNWLKIYLFLTFIIMSKEYFVGYISAITNHNRFIDLNLIQFKFLHYKVFNFMEDT